jgi:hypothetical protein
MKHSKPFLGARLSVVALMLVRKGKVRHMVENVSAFDAWFKKVEGETEGRKRLSPGGTWGAEDGAMLFATSFACL